MNRPLRCLFTRNEVATPFQLMAFSGNNSEHFSSSMAATLRSISTLRWLRSAFTRSLVAFSVLSYLINLLPNQTEAGIVPVWIAG